MKQIILIKRHCKSFYFSLLTFNFLLVFLSCSSRGPVHSHHSFPHFRKIDEILQDTLIQKGTTGIRIISAATGEILYDRNSNKFFSPASNMKLITTAGTLFILGGEFRFKTSLLTDGLISGDTLKGNIILQGKGDPTLDTEKLSKLAKRLKLIGISTIEGDMLFDDTYFDTIPYGRGWMWDDLEYGFGAPISALSVNRNTCQIYVKPGKNNGDNVIVYIEPETSFISFRNKATTGDIDNLTVKRIFENNKNIFIIRGTIPVQATTKKFIRSVEKPSLYTAFLFAEKLKEHQIKIHGDIKRGSTLRFLDTLLTNVSEPIIKILYDLNKESSNFLAEHILKTIGAEAEGVPGTARKGINATASFMKEKVILQSIFLQKDGSGLSRYNLISPCQITSLLFYLFHRFEYAPEFLTVLPTGGIDGTLRNRMREDDILRKVRAKTGTMSNVSTLSGYCITNSGKILIFSIMMKDYVAPISYVRNIQDEILKTLIKDY